MEKYCDYTNDCADGSDESSCATTASSATAESNYVDGSGVTEGDGFTGWVNLIDSQRQLNGHGS